MRFNSNLLNEESWLSESCSNLLWQKLKLRESDSRQRSNQWIFLRDLGSPGRRWIFLCSPTTRFGLLAGTRQKAERHADFYRNIILPIKCSSFRVRIIASWHPGQQNKLSARDRYTRKTGQYRTPSSDHRARCSLSCPLLPTSSAPGNIGARELHRSYAKIRRLRNAG